MISSNDQVIHIFYDEYLCSEVSPNEQGIVRLGHFEVDLVKILSYLRMSCFGFLLEAVEKLFQSVYCFWVCVRLETEWLYHVHLL